MEARGRRFESCCFYFWIFSSVEELSAHNRSVEGSNPSGSTWACSSAGRAPALHAGGQRFNPAQVHHERLAQSGEHLPYKQKVGGSSPSAFTYGLVAQLVEQRIEAPRVGGSSPSQATIGVSPSGKATDFDSVILGSNPRTPSYIGCAAARFPQKPAAFLFSSFAIAISRIFQFCKNLSSENVKPPHERKIPYFHH